MSGTGQLERERSLSELLLLREKSVDLAPIDQRPPTVGFQITRDRAGQPILAVDERQGTAAIVPGGVQLTDRPDERDVPLIWRYAHWMNSQDLLDDLPPDFVLDTSLVELICRHPNHARWMLERSAAQLNVVGSFLAADEQTPPAKTLAQRRTLYVFLELDAATRRFEKRTGQHAPDRVHEALARCNELLALHAHMPLNGMTMLNASEGDSEIRHWMVRSKVASNRLLMVFIKIMEGQRALETGSAQDLLSRLRLLRGALKLARYGTSKPDGLWRLPLLSNVREGIRYLGIRWTLLPIERRCDTAINRIDAGEWSDKAAARLRRRLRRDIARLNRGLAGPECPSRRKRLRSLPRQLELARAGHHRD